MLRWKAIRRGGIKSDEVPWCAAFGGGCLEAVGIVSSRYESAKSYLTWGQPLSAPVYGCIVVFERSERATRHWLGVCFDTDAELLEQILTGEVRETRVG